jgi:lambda repressor-like predicted transcriptional regulator
MTTPNTELFAQVRKAVDALDMPDELLAEIIGRTRKPEAAVAKVETWVAANAKPTRTPAAPIEITAPKGGDTKVEPKPGKIAAAIDASGLSLNAIARDHGLNPSQLRRLVADSVKWVDEVRAQAIADALGKKLSDLFGKPEVKASARTEEPAAGK